MPFSTKKMRALIERYEKWFMIGLVVFLLVIFTVTDTMTNMLSGAPEGEEPPRNSDIVGTFYVVPKEKVEVTYADFAEAQNAVRVWNVLTFAGRKEYSDLDVWSHIILREAARTQGILVSDQELVAQLRMSPIFATLMADKERYSRFTRDQFRMTRAQFENSFREALTAARVRRLYIDSYMVAPPATRVELVDRFAPGSFEFVEVSWAALDAAKFLEEESGKIKDAADPDKVLREFFESDPAVKEEATHFRHRRRYEFEMLYGVHERLNEENLARAKEMFFQAWPEWAKTEELKKEALNFGGEEEIQRFWATYQERLLKLEGKSLEQMRLQAEQEVDKDEETKEEPGKDGEEPAKDGDEEETDGNEEKKDEADDPIAKKAREDAILKAMEHNGLVLCRDRIIRELEFRRLYRRIHTDAFENPKQSLKDLWDRLKKFDDEKDPLCTLEPGKGLFVFRKTDKALGRPDIEKMKDGELEFGPNLSLRVSSAAREKLPYVRKSAEVLGDRAQGRMIVRVTGLERERRKTYPELDEGEKSILKKEFYVPHRARERSKEVLEALKKQIDDGKVKPDGFSEAAGTLGARVFEDEKMVAGTGFMQEPDDRLLFPSALTHMRDRYYLRSRLASLLASDRLKKEEERIKPGTWLDVQVRSDTEDATEDPGTAYLVLLLERKSPDASTLPEEDMARARMIATQQGIGRDRSRWETDYRQLFNDFEVQFEGAMKQRIDEDFQRREDRQRDRANLGAG
ncbi:MAG: SurA N-terminal domain-containing protein [Planctomycetota bacterium]|jgi:hypothetical protein